MGTMQWLISWFNYLSPVVFILFLVYYILGPRKRYMKKWHEALDSGITTGKETVELLKEIRDLLKK